MVVLLSSIAMLVHHLPYLTISHRGGRVGPCCDLMESTSEDAGAAGSTDSMHGSIWLLLTLYIDIYIYMYTTCIYVCVYKYTYIYIFIYVCLYA